MYTHHYVDWFCYASGSIILMIYINNSLKAVAKLLDNNSEHFLTDANDAKGLANSLSLTVKLKAKAKNSNKNM